MTWMEWRNIRWVALIFCGVALLLSLAYGLHWLPMPDSLSSHQSLGPWLTKWARYRLPGQHHVPFEATMTILPRWTDWYGAMFITLVGAVLGSRIRVNEAFLQLQPVSRTRIYVTRLLTGLTVLTGVCLISGTLIFLRGATPYEWLSRSELTQQYVSGLALLWLRGVVVLLATYLLAQWMPAAFASVVTVLLGLVLIGSHYDIFAFALTFFYQPERVPFSNNVNYEFNAIQAFILQIKPDRIQVAPDQGTLLIAIAIALVTGILGYVSYVRIRRIV